MSTNPLKIGSSEEFGTDWNISTLAEKTLFIKDGTHATHKRVEQGVPLLSAKDISKTGKIVLNNNPSLISKKDFELIHSKYEIQKDDILLTVVGTLGRCAICISKDKFSIQRSVAVIRVNKLVADVRYLYYFFSGIWFQSQLQLRSNSTAQAGVYLGELAQIEITCPTLPQQKKIAKILSTVDNLIEQTQALIDKYTAIKQGMMADLFTRGIDLSGTPDSNPNHGKLRPSFEEAPELYKKTELGWVPREWEIETIDSLLNQLIDYRGKTPRKTSEGIPLITAKNVRMGYLDSDPREYIAIDNYDSWMTRGIPEKGDILFTTEAPLGNVAQILTKDKVAFAQRVIILNVSNKINSNYFKYLLMSDRFRRTIFSRGSGSTVEGVKQSEFRKMKVVISTSEVEQLIISERLLAIDSSLIAKNKKSEKYKEIKKGLMQDLLTGKVRVNA